MRNFLRQFDHFWAQDKGLSSLLVVLCLMLFVIQPLVTLSRAGEILLNTFFTLLLISGVVYLGQNRALVAAVTGFALLAFGFCWIDLLYPDRFIQVTHSLLNVIFYGFIIRMVLGSIYKQGPVTSHRIRGAVVVYLLTGLVGSFAYQALYYGAPEASFAIVGRTKDHFAPEPGFLYFSFVTLTTTGCNDIIPVHPLAQALVMVEGLVGQLHPVIIISRLTGLTLK